MAIANKLGQMFKTNRDPNKDIILVTGMAAGFAGLEGYWVFRGWRKNHGSTVLMGILGIAITFALAWLYIAFA